jgi:glycosyltransferase involved in cell wall biosynthesis
MSISSPKITIVTPVYNGAKYIELLIQSVLEQSYPYIEHIIINDGSKDDGATTRILKKFPDLRWWERENRGQYATMNEGIEAATGEWVCFISADDFISPTAVSTIAEIIAKNPEADGIFGRTCFVNEDGSKYPVQQIFPSKLLLYRYLAQIPHCSVYMRRDYLIQHNLKFDESLKYNGDYDWFLSVLEEKPSLYYVSECLSSIRKHGAQISRVKFDEILEERELVFKKFEINMAVYRMWNFCLTLRHALLRILYQFRNGGFKAGISLIWYFIRHKLGLI